MENTNSNQKTQLINQNVDSCKSHIHFTGITHKINDLWNHKMFCDITLVSHDESVKICAHKLILCLSSDYFKGMFDGSMREATEKIVKLPINVGNGNILESIIKYIYRNRIEITIDNAEDLLTAACYLNLVSLKQVCCNFIGGQLDLKNCLYILLLADRYNLSDLYELAEKFVCENFQKLQKNEDLFKLEVDLLIKFLSSNNLNVYSEETVFECLISWINYDRSNREEQLSKLLRHVRFPLLSPEFIASSIEPECQSIECLQMVCSAFKWHLRLEDNLYKGYQIQFRNYNGLVFFLTGSTLSGNHLTIRLNDLNRNLDSIYSREIEPLSTPRSAFASCIFQNKLVICGGIMANNLPTNQVECLDMKTFKWSSLPSMIQNRKYCGLAAINGCLYAFFGVDRYDQILKTVEKYDPEKGEWANVASFNSYNIRCTKFTVAWNKLWVVVENSNARVKIASYDPKKDNWTTGSMFGFEGWVLGIAVVSYSDQKLLIVGSSHMVLYNVMTGNCTNIILSNNILGYDVINFQGFGDRFIAFCGNILMELDMSERRWKQIITVEEFDAVFSIG